MFAKAEPYLRQSLEILQAHAISDHWRQSTVQSALGAALAEQGKYEEAESLLLSGGRELLVERDKPPFPAPREIANAVRRIIRFYELTDQPEKSDEWRKIADEHDFRRPAERG